MMQTCRSVALPRIHTSLDMENSSANNSITHKKVKDIKSPPEALVTLICFQDCSFGGETSLVYTYA